MLQRAINPQTRRARSEDQGRQLARGHLVDDFAWLRAANWQEVMRDPLKLDPAIRAYLEAENDYAGRILAGTTALQDTLFAEMKGRIKEDDFDGPDRRRTLCLFPALSRRRPASRDLPPAPVGRSGRTPAGRRRTRARQGLLSPRRHGPRAGPPPARLVVGRGGRGVLHRPHPRSDHRTRSSRRRAGRVRFGRVDRRCIGFLLRPPRPQSSSVARVPAPARTAGGRRRPRLRGSGARLFRLRGRDPIAPVCRDLDLRSRDLRIMAHRSFRRERGSATRRRARDVGSIRCRAPP